MADKEMRWKLPLAHVRKQHRVALAGNWIQHLFNGQSRGVGKQLAHRSLLIWVFRQIAAHWSVEVDFTVEGKH